MHPMLMVYNWPTCDRCNKIVDRMTRVDNPMTDEIEFYAFCHGEREKAVVTRCTLATTIKGPLRFERAFMQKALDFTFLSGGG